MRQFVIEVQVRLQLAPRERRVHRQRVRDQVQRVVRKIHHALAVHFEIGFVDNVTLRHVPGPGGRERRVGLDVVMGIFRQVTADDLQRLVHAVRRKRAVQWDDLGKHVPQAADRFHGRNPVFGAFRRFEDVRETGAFVLPHRFHRHVEDFITFHQATLAQANRALVDHLAIEQCANRFKIEHHTAFHIAHEHGVRDVLRLALRVDGDAAEGFQKAIVHASGLLAVMQKGDRLAVGQAENKDFGVPLAELAKNGRLAKTVVRAVRGQLVGVLADGGH